jgi:hypothetical protein
MSTAAVAGLTIRPNNLGDRLEVDRKAIVVISTQEG